MKSKEIIKINLDVPLNKSHTNANIKCEKSDEELLKYGFTNYYKPHLYLSRNLGHDISFGLVIDCKTRDIKIDVLDENFCQPYDYQSMINLGFSNKVANDIHKKVQEIMKKLLDDGIIVGYNLGDYI